MPASSSPDFCSLARASNSFKSVKTNRSLRIVEAKGMRITPALSPKLDRKIGGGESAEILYKEAEVQDAKRGFAPNRMQSDHPFYDMPRRSLYLPVVRNALPDALALFDAADPPSRLLRGAGWGRVHPAARIGLGIPKW